MPSSSKATLFFTGTSRVVLMFPDRSATTMPNPDEAQLRHLTIDSQVEGPEADAADARGKNAFGVSDDGGGADDRLSLMHLDLRHASHYMGLLLYADRLYKRGHEHS